MHRTIQTPIAQVNWCRAWVWLNGVVGARMWWMADAADGPSSSAKNPAGNLGSIPQESGQRRCRAQWDRDGERSLRNPSKSFQKCRIISLKQLNESLKDPILNRDNPYPPPPLPLPSILKRPNSIGENPGQDAGQFASTEANLHSRLFLIWWVFSR